MSRIWMTETEQILRDNWNKISIDKIAELINDYLDNYYSGRYKSWNITSSGGVIYAAARIGLLTQEQYISIIENIKREKRNRRYVNQRIRLSILQDNPKCNLCGSTEDLTIDHILPVYFGGTSGINNLQVLCRSCNSKKGASFIK